jgi:hypothetical protein
LPQKQALPVNKFRKKNKPFKFIELNRLLWPWTWICSLHKLAACKLDVVLVLCGFRFRQGLELVPGLQHSRLHLTSSSGSIVTIDKRKGKERVLSAFQVEERTYYPFTTAPEPNRNGRPAAAPRTASL